ncbi:hypothetical protein F164LOC_18175 [Pectobacterium carotovorum]|uniref:hypothetical protein n=1 Tax=Pectobacterium versatile TaxID=2488639 RepID=UPI000C7F1C82|nr:hypothetical protein [Pectobacterium versatile]PLY35822.1 hypothetical protein F164LOC_18175 [Pectobacterium carotovorum]
MKNLNLKKAFRKLASINNLILISLFIPIYAHAAWYDPIVKFVKEFQTAIIIIGGAAAVGSLVYVGISWIISRMSGNMETTAMDYFKHAAVIGAVGGAVALATWAYSVWGGQVS